MTLKVNQNIRLADAKGVVLPPWTDVDGDIIPNLAIPDVYVLDAIQKYPIGAKFIDWNKVFYYGYCSEKNSVAGRASGGMKNAAVVFEDETDAVVEPVGETEIVVTNPANDVTKNKFAGGDYMPYTTTGLSTYRILSNTKAAGGKFTVTLERGLLVASTSGMTVRLSRNQYAELCCELPNAGKHYSSSMGVNLVEAEAGKWLWIQTYGPCYVHGGDELLGVDSADRMGYFHIDGSLLTPVNPAEGAVGNNLQIAGYAINRGDGTASAWYVFLQLAN